MRSRLKTPRVPLRCLALLLSVALIPADASALVLDQVDDFQDGQQAGWGGGSQGITITTDGGPDGAGDRYMTFASTGQGGNNSRMVIPNEGFGNQWQGDYPALGVGGIVFDVLNDGVSQLDLRVAIGTATTWFASTDAVIVPTGGDWTSVSFMISEETMSPIGSGTSTFAEVVGDVQKLRILSSVDLPPASFGGSGSAQGDVIDASIGVDNIRVAIPEPGCLALVAMGLASLAGRRRG